MGIIHLNRVFSNMPSEIPQNGAKIHEHFHQMKVSDLGTPKEQIVTLSPQNCIEEAINLLSKHKIHSIPVMDKKNCIGLLDFVDIAHFIARASPDDEELTRDLLQSLEIAGRTIALETVDNILNESQMDPFVPVFVGNNMSMVVELMASGIHRVPICDEEGALQGAISQTDLIKYLNENVKQIDKQFAQKAVEQLGLHSKPVASVNLHDSVLCAVSLIKSARVSGVAVVSSDGRLVGNFGAVDCVGFYRDNIPALLDPVADFLENNSPKSMKPIVCKSDLTITEVISEMIQSHVHHIYVVDDDFKPASIISATDVLRALINYTQ